MDEAGQRGEEAPGPIDFVVIEFPAGPDTAAAADELRAVVDMGIVSLLDIAVVTKSAGGDVARGEVSDAALAGFSQFAGAVSGLFDEADIAEVGEILDPGVTALVVAYENTWASRFVDAADNAGGRVVASDRIPAQVILDALDSLESDGV